MARGVNEDRKLGLGLGPVLIVYSYYFYINLH